MARRWFATGRPLPKLRSPDLFAAAVVVAVAWLAVFLNLPTPIRAVLTAPLVFFLPGYALIAATMPRVRLQQIERLLLSLALSIAVAALVGLGIGLARVALTTASWAIALGGVTLLALIVGMFRRPRTPPTIEKGDRFHRRHVALAGLVAVLAVGVIGATRIITANQEAVTPAQLWIMESALPGHVRVGVTASSSGDTYRLRLTSGGNLIEEFDDDLHLAPGQTWETDVPVADEDRQRPLVARLFRAGDDDEIRFVVLQPQPSPE